MRIAALSFLLLSFFSTTVLAQDCRCEKEFSYVRDFVEKNYAGFVDKKRQMGEQEYRQLTAQYEKMSKEPGADDKCLLLISGFLDRFRDDHIQIGASFDATRTDTAMVRSRRIVNIAASRIEQLKKSKSAEGVYRFHFDSSYTIAVIKEKHPLYDYAGIIVESKLPTWKKGMVKFYAKSINDSLLKGVLFMRNHMPKVEWFFLGKNSIGGDWQRVGTSRQSAGSTYVPVASKKLTDKTFYIKISSFSPSNAKRIDSLFKTHQSSLATLPYLVIDLRGNGGGADFAFSPVLPYLYTNPVKNIGVDVLSTEANIAGWKKILEDDDIPEQTRKSIISMIGKMEFEKGKLVNIVGDETDSSFAVMNFPKKVAILIDYGCASTTEQFLLFAKQSSKVIMLGENTQGTLDYSNMREAPFSCMPYILRYATTRSRRLDIGQGIDLEGVKPDHYLKAGTDWIEAAVKMLEN